MRVGGCTRGSLLAPAEDAYYTGEKRKEKELYGDPPVSKALSPSSLALVRKVLTKERRSIREHGKGGRKGATIVFPFLPSLFL